MVQPIQYIRRPDPSSILDQALSGYQAGLRIKAAREQNRLLEEDRQRKQAFRDDMLDLKGSFSPEKVTDMLLRYPEFGQRMSSVFGHLGQVNKKNLSMQMGRLKMLGSNPELQLKRIKEFAAAYRERGDVATAGVFEELAGGYDINDPQGNARDLGILETTLDPERALKVAQIATEEEKGYSYGALAKSRLEDVKKTKQETQKILNELKTQANVQGGQIEASERPSWELKLRKQYLDEGGKDLRLMERAKDGIVKSSLTGVGKLSTILSYMKLLDPTSVVSPGEQATAQNAPGWTASMRTLWNKYTGEGEFDKDGLMQFKGEAIRLYNQSKSQSKKVMDRISSQAKRYGLNVDNIFSQEEQAGKLDILTDKDSMTVITPDGRKFTAQNLEQYNLFIKKIEQASK